MHFERLLVFLEGQLGVLRAGRLPNYDLLCDVTTYFCYFGNRYHHAREEVAFGYIVQSNPAMSGTIRRLVQEHEEIADQGQELTALLARAVDGNAQARDSIEGPLLAFVAAYRNHISTEEQDVLPYAADSLSAMQWERVAGARPPGPDPHLGNGASRHSLTFGSEAQARYQALCEMIRTGNSSRSRVRRVHPIEAHQERGAGSRKKVAGYLGVARAKSKPRGNAAARSALVRQTIGLLALVAAYLQYYFLDVHLKIENLPSMMVFL